MTKTKPWAQLRDKLEDTPEQETLAAQYRHAMDTAEALGTILDECTTARGDSDETSDASIEQDEGEYLAAVRNYVELLGGELEITAVFADQKIRLVPADVDEQHASEGD